ncbi:MAG: hypothetical protein NTX28_17620 [Novosphingobium sp.]|nr:hypothetical protein [Novosphingobium sp.]
MARMSDAKPAMTREERLAARLRENLRRRKVQERKMQARAMEATSPAEPESPPSPETGLSNPVP